jgi:hypothetical protein
MRVGWGLTRSWNCGGELFEAKVFRPSSLKTEYMMYDFSSITQEVEDVRLDGQVIPKKDTFHYLGSMLQKDGDIDENVSHKIKVG